MANVFVILNETHSLMAEQEALLNQHFPEGWQILPVPNAGWAAEEQREQLALLGEAEIVFASPLPLMLKLAAQRQHCGTYVFHNDRREKKELPNGKIIMVVAQTGWQLL
jgi:hypothetical protein